MQNLPHFLTSQFGAIVSSIALWMTTAALPGQASESAAADASQFIKHSEPVPRTDLNSRLAHEQLVQKAKQGGIDVYACNALGNLLAIDLPAPCAKP